MPSSPASVPQVEIDLDAICANYRTLKAAAPGADIAPVVKCNGYGLGAAPVARVLAAREGARKFFVAYAREGAELREALAGIAPNAVIYVFNGPDAETLAAFAEHALTPVLNSRDQARLWASSRPGAPAALHIDTGLNRLGAPVGELSDIAAMRGLKIALVMSHLACGSDPGHEMNRRQHLAFERARADFPDARRSLSASAGAFMGLIYHYDLVRPGIALYGASPFDLPSPKRSRPIPSPPKDGFAQAGRPDPRLKPVATLTAPVLQIHLAGAGDSAGYGATHTFRKDTRLATVGLGYGDGFPRAASNRGTAFLGGALCPIAGRVSMDLIILDVTNAPEPIEIGKRAEFFGRRLPIEDAARAADTIAYELLTGLGGRLYRRYLLDGRPIDADDIGGAGEGKRA